MSFDLQRILESKRAFRHGLAARPIEEKLRLLDELCARTLAIRGGAEFARAPTTVSEPKAEYRPDK